MSKKVESVFCWRQNMIYTGCGAECTKLQDDFVWHVKENDRHLKVTHNTFGVSYVPLYLCAVPYSFLLSSHHILGVSPYLQPGLATFIYQLNSPFWSREQESRTEHVRRQKAGLYNHRPADFFSWNQDLIFSCLLASCVLATSFPTCGVGVGGNAYRFIISVSLRLGLLGCSYRLQNL